MDRQVGKLTGLTGVKDNEGYGGNRSTGKGWSARIGFGPPTTSGLIPMGLYIYHMYQDNDYGDFYHINDVEREKAFDVYLRVDLDDNGRGLIKCSIDGATKSNLFDLTNGDSKLGLWHDVYHGGSQPAQENQFVIFNSITAR